jgi:hypothetical protein
VFGPSRSGWKLAGALALAALFGVSSAVRGRDLNPPLWRLASTPDRWDGETLWIPGAVVRSCGSGFLVVEVDGLRLPVRGALEAAPGDLVSVRGTFRARERGLDLLSGRKLSAGPWRRGLMEAVSLAVLAWVLWNFHRHFRGPR